MTLSNAIEINWLVYTIICTAFMWVPYIVRLVLQLGPLNALAETEGDARHKYAWAARAKRAHYNAIENLIIYAPLVILICLLGLNNEQTKSACIVYFFARIGHYFVYTFGVKYMRTPLFAIGFVCQIVLMVTLINGL